MNRKRHTEVPFSDFAGRSQLMPTFINSDWLSNTLSATASLVRRANPEHQQLAQKNSLRSTILALTSAGGAAPPPNA
jgi:hypothetical protein